MLYVKGINQYIIDSQTSLTASIVKIDSYNKNYLKMVKPCA